MNHRSPFNRIVSLLLAGLLLFMQPAVILAEGDSGDQSQSQATVLDPATSAAPDSNDPASNDTTGDTSQDAGQNAVTPDQTGPTTQPGPQDPVGPQGATGPQTQPGPTSSTSSQDEQTGPAGPTGTKPTYAFNDAINRWEPTLLDSFSWNGSIWTSPFYNYDSVTGWYHVKPKVTPSAAINALTAGSGDPAKMLASILGADPSNTGPNSNNAANVTDMRKVLAQIFNNTGVTNAFNQTGQSGNASVTGNTMAGDATSGAVNVVLNLLNVLNAMWSFGTSGLGYFVHNIFGDQTGDVNLDNDISGAVGGPSSVGALPACTAGSVGNENTGTSSTNTATSTCNRDVALRSATNQGITNNINVDANSGNATVSGNTNGGNATSGEARAELNIINLINTAIGAGKSFLGMINIFGNLNGDLLFPSLNLNGAVASGTGSGDPTNSNTGPNSINTASSSNSNNASVTNNLNAAVNNNIDAKATSGNATVSTNTTAGDATTGSADTNSALFNLFNTSVFGDNAVLVIINDMGHWVGRIMNLGVSDNSGGGLLTSNATVGNTNTGPNSSNTATSSNTNNTTVTNDANETITNNVRARAQSGDATVSDNTKAGNATSGNASISSNVANILGSSLNFTHTFGILFINIFGTWTGSVGENTAAGNAGSGGGTALATSNNQPSIFTPAGLAAWISGPSSQNQGNGNNTGSAQAGTTSNNASFAGGSTIVAAAHTAQVAAKQAAQNTALLALLAAGVMMMAAAAFALERKFKK